MSTKTENYHGKHLIKQPQGPASHISYNLHLSGSTDNIPSIGEAVEFLIKNEDIRLRPIIENKIRAYLKDIKTDVDEVTFPLAGFRVVTRVSNPGWFTLTTL